MCTGGGNYFPTNNYGGNMGLRTSLPQVGPSGYTQGIGPSNSYMAPGGSYGQYQTPDWINAGLYAANQPIQNYPIGTYGRWNWQNGATNGAGMSQSGWPSPQSITQPYGGYSSSPWTGQQWQPNPMQGGGNQPQFPSTAGTPPGQPIPQSGTGSAPAGNTAAFANLWQQYANNPAMRQILLQQTMRYGGSAPINASISNADINAYSAGGSNWGGSQAGMSDPAYTQAIQQMNQTLGGAGFNITDQRAPSDYTAFRQRLQGR